MNLIYKLIKNDCFIEGINKEELISILSQTHPSIKINTIAHGSIILSNNKIIKCAHKYYKDTNNEIIPTIRTPHACYEYQKKLGTQCMPFQCLICHLQCLGKLKEKTLSVR